ncbi:MAG TPA: Hsp20/alpha crystallin family protein [Gemmatimonadaceae bacterium]|nr:Hsp20/alpha crystallin family protein [Gemmatimonadaceae bacterium]
MTDNITKERTGGIGSATGSSQSSPQGTRGDREQGIQTTRDREVGVRTPSRFSLFDRGAFGNTQALMRHMAEDFDQLWQAFGFGNLGNLPTLRNVWTPQIEVQRKDGQIIVKADLPGINPDDVNVELDDGVLTVSGERKEEHEEKEEGYFRSERSYGSFYRAIPLPEGVDENRIEAKFDNGVLEVKVPEPRQEQKRPKRVDVRRGSR